MPHRSSRRCLPPSILATLLVAAIACGGPSEPSAAREATPPATGAEGAAPAADGANALTDGDAEDEPQEPASCIDRSAASCERGDCVWDPDPGIGCREPADECERVDTRGFVQSGVSSHGDPCHAIRAECAWNPTSTRCVRFEPLAECPATYPEAQTTRVHCQHPDQPQLQCAYDEGTCACAFPRQCGGIPQSRRQQFVCTPKVDSRGCPSDAPRVGARCRVDPVHLCEIGCNVGFRCENGRWRRHALQPRP